MDMGYSFFNYEIGIMNYQNPSFQLLVRLLMFRLFSEFIIDVTHRPEGLGKIQA